MMEIVRDDYVAKFILERKLSCSFAGTFSGWVFVDDGFPVGSYILNGYTGHNVNLTAAINKPIPARLIRQIARDCFTTYNVTRVTAHTRVSNTKAIKALTAIGFRSEGTAHDFFGNEDAEVFALLRREQRLLKELS